MSFTARSAVFLVCWQIAAPGLAVDRAPRGADFFERKIRPIFVNRCSECHGPETAEANLRLDSAAGLFAGGDSGPTVIPADVEASRLIQRVRGRGDLQMPPDDRLEPHEIAALEQWVAQGAFWPGYEGRPATPKNDRSNGPLFTDAQKSFWSFQPIRKAHPPSVADDDWPASPIDRFILARLESQGISPAPPADRRTLLRRMTYDLTGLPPTPDEINAFLADESPDAIARAVDRLLASPRYGEQWAQHWLDVVRYAESAGHDGNNAYLHAWRYRDYVIQALNEDKPFNQFLIEQIAGDLLPKTGDPDQDYQQLAAVGFLQVGPKPVVMRDKRQMLLDIADEQLHTLGVAFMGLTLGCARCHDHKFDPIPAADYYSLAGILTSTRVMADQLNDSKWVEEEVAGPDGVPVKLMMVRDSEEPHDLPIHLRGNYRSLAEQAPRRFLQIIAGEDHPPIETEGSGRLELARWLAHPSHPLTARVIVNRLWQHHFGQGLVASSGNFGFQGEKPSHPALLDWLASQLVEQGWSLKAMHRLMLLSSTYQQAHIVNEDALARDPQNQLLWRMPRRRLSAEQLRDTLLMVSGEMDFAMGDTLFTEGYAANDPKRELFVVDISGGENYPPFLKPRRSIYLPVIRNGRPEFATLFDSPTAHESTSVRGESTVPTQALMLMNSPFVRDRALALAREIVADLGPSAEQSLKEAAIASLYERILARPATNEETAAAIDFVDKYAEAALKFPESLTTAQVAQAGEEEYAEMVRQQQGLLNYQRFGGIDLDGFDDWFELHAEQSLNAATDEMSVECWLLPRDVRPYMLVVGRDGVDDRLWKIGLYGRDVGGSRQNVVFSQFFDAELGGERVMDSPDGIVPLEQWTHVVMTYGNGRRRLFVNGKLLDEIAANGAVRSSKQSLVVGARGGQSEWFHGKVDHVAVFQIELSAETVLGHYGAFRKSVSAAEQPAEVLAWRACCQSLFCLNEFIYLE